MTSRSRSNELTLMVYFDRFIKDSRGGKRLQPNGKRIGKGTLANYGYTQSLLKQFSEKKSYPLRIKQIHHLSKREIEVEKNYWKKFYKRFTDYLYHDCGHYDNYVGQNIKIIRAFFNYLNKDLVLGVGDFHKSFYVREEEIPIFPLMPEELNFLINDKNFESSLDKRMKEVKDFVVFGCTVALRVSDLFSLTKSNIRVINADHYLAVRSVKTRTDTLVKIPPYAVEIINRYKKQKRLLPHFNKSNLNKYIKELLELAGFTSPVQKIREKRGTAMEIKKEGSSVTTQMRFCDMASTHIMRRTAITTMLSLGVPEQVVRKISGHAPGSKEFYKYVLWAQTYQDKETEKVFKKLQEMNLDRA